MKKELWFGFSLMAIILLTVAIFMPWTAMTNGHLGLLMLALVVVAIMLGFPTAFTLMGMGMIFSFFAYWSQNAGHSERAAELTLALMVQKAFGVMSNDVLISIPLFVFMGYLVERANLIEKLFKSLHLALARVPGSLAVATVFTCAVFATATGIVGAVVTLMGLLALPAMLKAGYDVRLSAGAITAGGCLGILIPPSVMLIVYGATAGVSVVQLYAGAFFPGIMLALLYIGYIIIIAKLKPKWAPPLTEEQRFVPLPPHAVSLSTSTRTRALPALLAALGTRRPQGVSTGTVWREIGVILMPAILFTIIMGLSWNAITKPDTPADTSSLELMSAIDAGATKNANADSVKEPQADGVALPPGAAAEGVKEPPSASAKSDGVQEPPSGASGAKAFDSVREPPGADGVKEPPAADGVKEPPSADGVTEPPQADGVKEPPSSAKTSDGLREPPGTNGVQEPPGTVPAKTDAKADQGAVAEPPGTLAEPGKPTAAADTGSANTPSATQKGQRTPTPTAFWIVLGIGAASLAVLYALFTFARVEIFKMLLASFFPLAILILAVLGSIVFGLATPTEAAAIGSFGGFVLAAIYLAIAKGPAETKRILLTWLPFWAVFMISVVWFLLYKFEVLSTLPIAEVGWISIAAIGIWCLLAAWQVKLGPMVKESSFLTAKTSAMVCWLFVGSSIFSAAFALLGGQEIIEKWVLSMNLTPLEFMLLSQFIIFVLGWPLEWTEIIVIFMPIFIPLLPHFNIDPLFFGLLVALNLQTAFLSPPVAMAAFYLKGVSPPHVTLNQIFAGMLPFMAIQVLALFLLYAFPQIGLWLPEVLYK
jgi:TRAP-type mannitol/chloroaromatic compound transport system permease large subunit